METGKITRVEEVQSLVIAREALQALRRLSRREYPLEACAALFGGVNGPEVVISIAERLTNVHHSSYRYGISESELSRVVARRAGFVGLFHSHPGSPRPSRKDRQNARRYGILWLIGAVHADEFTLAGFIQTSVGLLTLNPVTS